jgi:thymidine kinase
MFIEPNIRGDRRGWIEVICGSMFSGKTEELIRRLKRAKIANLKTEIFKPAIDVRYDEIKIVSHDENAIQSTPVGNSQQILLLAGDVDVVGVDEAQFFDPEIANVCDELAFRGVRVIVAGLDMDYLETRLAKFLIFCQKLTISPNYMQLCQVRQYCKL